MNFQVSLLQIVSGGSAFVGGGDLSYIGMVRVEIKEEGRSAYQHWEESSEARSPFLSNYVHFKLGKYTHRSMGLLGRPFRSTGSACAGARMLVGGLGVVAGLGPC